MKKSLLLLIAFAFTTLLGNSQSFSDDFESYSTGDYIGQNNATWTTWSGTEGGTEDTPVTTAQAHSGTNAAYYSSTATTGGPQDCVLPFGGELTVGQFNFEMWMYVNSGTGAYFNFQADATIGTTWALDTYFNTDLTLQFTSGGGLQLETTYPQGEWFKLRMENNLSTNSWEIFVNDISQGSFSNAQVVIASMDIFPLTGNQFYIDDVNYEYTGYTQPQLNGAMTSIVGMSSGLVGQSVTPSLQIRNLGLTAINSCTVNLDYNGQSHSMDISGVNIAPLAFYTVVLDQNFTLGGGTQTATATISNVNGGADNDAQDDIRTLDITPIQPALGKKVVAEEGTGTWCPWCVRGAVFMELLSERYDEFYIGVAVHNADPMTVTEYDTAIGGLITGYPSGLVDRAGGEFDPSQFEIPFLERVQTTPMAFIENGAIWNAVTRELQVSAMTTFQQTVTGNYKIAFVLTEDGVTGTTSDYAQNNAYAGGTNGVMGGYEVLPGTVPAAQMVYDHVARAITPSFNGLTNAFTGAQNAGNATAYNTTFTLPAEWDENNVHIIAMVIAPDGTIDNAESVTIVQGVENGYISGLVLGQNEIVESTFEKQIQLYPNPATDNSFINLNLNRSEKVTVTVMGADGKILADKSYGTLSGNLRLPINLSGFSNGLYLVKVMIGGKVTTMTLVKE
jgi:hypothetical protein